MTKGINSCAAEAERKEERNKEINRGEAAVSLVLLSSEFQTTYWSGEIFFKDKSLIKGKDW